MSRKLAEVIAAMEQRYPSSSAQEWDAVGLVCGDPKSEISKVLFAVDPHELVIEQALDINAQLIIAHHPLMLKGVTSVSQLSRKGRIITELIKRDIALFTAHTNADVANPGVSDALAIAVGVEVSGALENDSNLGRIGQLAKRMPLADFAAQVDSGLPKTARGIHIAGDLNQIIENVAICGGAGDSLLDLVAQTNADVYITSDLKYHVAQEFVQSTGKSLIEISHWAGEWPWLNQAAQFLTQDLGSTLETQVSALSTDPWVLTRVHSAHLNSEE